jgi:hypothetical protein
MSIGGDHPCTQSVSQSVSHSVIQSVGWKSFVALTSCQFELWKLEEGGIEMGEECVCGHPV